MNPTSQPPHSIETPCSHSDDLKAFFDGELSFWQARRVRLHLRRCAQCREELAMIQTITEELTQERESESQTALAPELRAQILDAAHQTTPTAPPQTTPEPKPSFDASRPTFRLAPWLAFVPVAACLGVLLLTMTGGKIKNTFNAASSAINTSTDGGEIWTGFGSSGAAGVPSSGNDSNPVAGMGNSSSQTSSSGASSEGFERRVRKEGSLSVAVRDVEKGSDAVMSIVKTVGGFVASNSLSSQNGRYAQLETRVPVAKFEQVVSKIGQLGQVRAKNISGEDITDRYVATQARRDTLNRQVVALQAQVRALQARANRKNREERRELQNQLSDARARLAEAAAQYQAAHRLSALSSLSVTLQEKAPAATPASLSQDLSKTGREAWASFLTSVRVPLTLLIYALAYSPLWLPAILLWRRYAPPPRR